jgi:hypothetical protein
MIYQAKWVIDECIVTMGNDEMRVRRLSAFLFTWQTGEGKEQQSTNV